MGPRVPAPGVLPHKEPRWLLPLSWADTPHGRLTLALCLEHRRCGCHIYTFLLLSSFFISVIDDVEFITGDADNVEIRTSPCFERRAFGIRLLSRD